MALSKKLKPRPAPTLVGAADEEKETKIKRMIDSLHDVLFDKPANTLEEIATRMTKNMGEKISLADAGLALGRQRKEYADGLWHFFIPHVKRGPPKAGETDRYRLYPEKPSDTSVTFDEISRENLRNGNVSTVRTIYRQSSNSAANLLGELPYHRSPKRREDLEELQKDLADIARRSRRILKEMKADAA